MSLGTPFRLPIALSVAGAALVAGVLAIARLEGPNPEPAGRVRVRVSASVLGHPETLDQHRFTAPVRPAPLDRFGNPVTEAVARYRLDGTGVLYEIHSPEIDVPRLPSPSS